MDNLKPILDYHYLVNNNISFLVEGLMPPKKIDSLEPTNSGAYLQFPPITGALNMDDIIEPMNKREMDQREYFLNKQKEREEIERADKFLEEMASKDIYNQMYQSHLQNGLANNIAKVIMSFDTQDNKKTKIREELNKLLSSGLSPVESVKMLKKVFDSLGVKQDIADLIPNLQAQNNGLHVPMPPNIVNTGNPQDIIRARQAQDIASANAIDRALRQEQGEEKAITKLTKAQDELDILDELVEEEEPKKEDDDLNPEDVVVDDDVPIKRSFKKGEKWRLYDGEDLQVALQRKKAIKDLMTSSGVMNKEDKKVLSKVLKAFNGTRRDDLETIRAKLEDMELAIDKYINPDTGDFRRLTTDQMSQNINYRHKSQRF